MSRPPRLHHIRTNQDSARPVLNTAPMSIPHATTTVPPALPPPRHIPEIAAGLDPGWEWANDPNASNFGRSAPIRQDSSLLGGGRWSDLGEDYDVVAHRPDGRAHHRGTSSTSTLTAAYRDDVEMMDVADSPLGDSPDPLRRSSNYRLHGAQQLEQRTLEASSNTYDKHLLSRIGGPNGAPTSKRASVSYSANGSGNVMVETSSPAQAQPNQRERSHDFEQRMQMHVQPRQQEPERQHPLPPPVQPQLQSRLVAPSGRSQQTSLASPASSSWSHMIGATSPGSTCVHPGHGPPERIRTQMRHGSSNLDDGLSRRASACDTPIFTPDDINSDDARAMPIDSHDRFAASDAYQRPLAARPGTKRRASSPPRGFAREDRLSSDVSNSGEGYDRRPVQQHPSRASPSSRYHAATSSSLSSASSFGQLHGSLSSSVGLSSVPSSVTSYGSDRVASPNALSPAFDPELRLNRHFAATNLHPTAADVKSPSYPYHHTRTLSGSSQIEAPSAASTPAEPGRPHPTSHVSGVFMCQCCPKKPKKFKTQEELRVHESEKQYTCQYCTNRFKNKNEAERHQNSLHLRRHSWSCAALAGAEAAFHGAAHGNSHDVCGYCGDEFTNPPQWDVRAEHLNIKHKFGECNQTKKFFRADHFRQHLKHSHAGSSGKWTNMLETACMKDEPLPEKRGASTGNGGGGGRDILEETPLDS